MRYAGSLITLFTDLVYGTACNLMSEKDSPAIHDLKNCVEGLSYNYRQN